MKKTFLTGSLFGLFLILFLAATVSAEAPTITANATSPADVYTNTDFKFSMTATDPDNATFTGYVQFYVNGTASGVTLNHSMNNNTNTLIGTLSSSLFNKGATLTAEYWADDGTNTTAKVNTTSVTVQNSVPTISPKTGTITIDSHESSDTATISVSDTDGDSLTYSVVSGNTSLATCSRSGSTLTATRVGDEVGTTTCNITVDDSDGGKATAVFTINVNRKSMLSIKDLDVYVDDKKQDLDDGEEIDKEAKPESNIKFDFVIKNLFDEDIDDIEIEDISITVIIKDIDDGSDLEEETREFDLDAEERSSIKSVEFELPTDVEQDDYEVEVIVEGEEKGSNIKHRVEWTLTLKVEKEKHDMKLKRAEFDQTTLSCDRETRFNVRLVNFGRSDEDEIILTIENSALGINIKQEDIDIDEGDDWSRSFTITVPDDVSPGTYKVVTKMYYDKSDYYDKEFELNAYGSTNLIIKKCVVTTPVEEEEEEEVPEDEGEIIIVEPTEGEEGEGKEAPTGGEVTREISFMDTSLYLVLLVATVVILGLILLVMFFKLLSK